MTKSDHVWRPKATGNGSGDRASQTLLSSRLALLNQMPRIPSSRSPAQKRQTARIQALRTAHRRSLPITEDEQAEILRLKAKVKDLQWELSEIDNNSNRVHPMPPCWWATMPRKASVMAAFGMDLTIHAPMTPCSW